MNSKIIKTITLVVIILMNVSCSSSDETHSSKVQSSMKYRQFDGPYLFFNEDQFLALHGEFINDKFQPKKELTSDLEYDISIPEKYVHFSVAVQRDHEVPPYKYDAPEKIFTLSDVEGDFDFFYKLLLKNEIINNQFEWIYGTGHLVVLGDMFDRGDLVTEALWLMYKLDYEAKKSGGYVHIIMGNHEAMALQGDDRYVNDKYFKVASSFDLKYDELFSNESVLGNWLRSKNSVEIIGNTLMVHAGISPILNATGMDIPTINNLIRNVLKKPVNQRLSSEERLVMGNDGPLWYRDYVEEKMSKEAVDIILDNYEADRIVVGHTVVDQVTALYDNRVLAIDVKRKNKDIYEALLIENDQLYRVTSKGDKHPL